MHCTYIDTWIAPSPAQIHGRLFCQLPLRSVLSLFMPVAKNSGGLSRCVLCPHEPARPLPLECGRAVLDGGSDLLGPQNVALSHSSLKLTVAACGQCWFSRHLSAALLASRPVFLFLFFSYRPDQEVSCTQPCGSHASFDRWL